MHADEDESSQAKASRTKAPLTIGGCSSACDGVTGTAYSTFATNTACSALDAVARYFCMESDAVQAALELTIIHLFAFIEFNNRSASPERYDERYLILTSVQVSSDWICFRR